MPNVKVHVDHAVWAERSGDILASLIPIRNMLCADYRVDASYCQFAVFPVFGPEDQTQVSVEIQILPKPERTSELIKDSCQRLQAMLAEAAGVHTAVRATQLDPGTYLALR